MRKPLKNYAFIDSQNVNLGVQQLGWKLDWGRFRIYLREKYAADTAYLFLGYLPQQQELYRSLQRAGYVVIFKPVLVTPRGKVKGNVDAELVLQAMIDYDKYDRAVIATSDGDFFCLVNYLYEQGKLEEVLSPARATTSALLKKAARGRIRFLDVLREKLEYRGKK